MARLAKAMDEAGGIVLITADHGNCEMMRDPETGGPHTSHTTNPVPLLLVGCPGASITGGRLADIGPTVLDFDGASEAARDDWHLVMR